MRVLIPGPLVSYTKRAEVDADGATLDDVLLDLDRRYPGIRFRMIDEQGGMRRHVRFFVNGVQVRDVAVALNPSDELHIVQALSGG
jgi:molybdopterin synthase sulfur carrier subunit